MFKLSAVLILVLMIAFAAFAREEEDKTIIGIVTDVEWLNSSLTVRYHQPRSGVLDEVTLRVPKEAVLTRGTKTISFSDIRQSDKVTVTYFFDDFSGLQVKRLHDQNSGNR